MEKVEADRDWMGATSVRIAYEYKKLWGAKNREFLDFVKLVLQVEEVTNKSLHQWCTWKGDDETLRFLACLSIAQTAIEHALLFDESNASTSEASAPNNH